MYAVRTMTDADFLRTVRTVASPQTVAAQHANFDPKDHHAHKQPKEPMKENASREAECYRDEDIRDNRNDAAYCDASDIQNAGASAAYVSPSMKLCG